MDKTDIIFNLAEILGCEARKYEPLSKHTTFKIGGVADTYVKVTSLSKLSTILKECRESDIDYMIIGNGSNILASDDGYRGVVIRLDGDFRKIALVDEQRTERLGVCVGHPRKRRRRGVYERRRLRR